MKKSLDLIYGNHPIMSAIANSKRNLEKIYITPNHKLLEQLRSMVPESKIIIKSKNDLDKLFTSDVNHQSIVGYFTPLKSDLNQIMKDENSKLIVLLDQIIDPHNIGSIIRSAAAFGASCVINTEHNSPEFNATIAKTSAGCSELIPYIKVTNLVNTIDLLKKQNYWVIGLDVNTEKGLKDIPKLDKIALVLGSEQKGMRSLVKKNLDIVAKIPMAREVESLNVSNAAAISLFHIFSSVLDFS